MKTTNPQQKLLRDPVQESAVSLQSQPLKPFPATSLPAAARSTGPGSVDFLRHRAHSFAAKLDEEQRTLLRHWFLFMPIPEIQKRVAAPPPDGFGLQVHDYTLRRLQAKWAATSEIDNLVLNAGVADEISHTLEETRPDFAAATVQLLLKRAFELTRAGYSENEGESVTELIAAVVKLRELELKAERLYLRRLSLTAPQTRPHRVDLNVTTPQPPNPPASPPPQ